MTDGWADISSAGFQDHAIGPVIGADNNTGGGANIWSHDDLLNTLPALPSPFSRCRRFTGRPTNVPLYHWRFFGVFGHWTQRRSGDRGLWRDGGYVGFTGFL